MFSNNIAIITPDQYDIVDRDLTPVARKNLVAVARTLQNLFNLILFDVEKQVITPLSKHIYMYTYNNNVVLSMFVVAVDGAGQQLDQRQD